MPDLLQSNFWQPCGSGMASNLVNPGFVQFWRPLGGPLFDARLKCEPPDRTGGQAMAARNIDTRTHDLTARIEDGVAVLTMNRPERRNAFSPEMMRALGEVLAACETDAAVGAIMLTGAGGAFCAGGDVKGMAERNEGMAQLDLDSRIHGQRLSQRATAGRL